MRVGEIIRRLSGFSTPIGGFQWQPPAETEFEIAQRVIAFLEDRRVLYNPSEVEVPEHCFRSVVDIRQHLTDELGRLDQKSGLARGLRGIRAECRKFLDANQISVEAERLVLPRGLREGHLGHPQWVFEQSLGQLRGVVGIYIAEIAAHHKLDVEEPLASILPAVPE